MEGGLRLRERLTPAEPACKHPDDETENALERLKAAEGKLVKAKVAIVNGKQSATKVVANAATGLMGKRRPRWPWIPTPTCTTSGSARRWTVSSA
jgi:hypothetical protein